MGRNLKVLPSISGFLLCALQSSPVFADAAPAPVAPHTVARAEVQQLTAADARVQATVANIPAVSPLPATAVPAAAVPAVAPAFVGANAASAPHPYRDVTMVSQAAMSGARKAAEHDPLLTRLGKIASPDWDRDQIQAFVNSPGGYGTVSGMPVPVPGASSPGLLQEFGCTHVLVQNFHRTQRNVQLVIYTFVGPEGAYGAYSVLRDGASTVIVRGGASSETDRSISFWQGRRFVVITSASEDDEVSKALVSSLADQTSALIRERADMPALLTGLSGLYRVQGSEKFFMGSAAARRFSPMPHVAALSIDRSLGAAFLEYHFPSPQPDRMKALLVDYPNAEAASSVYSAYTAALAEGHKSWILQPDRLLCKLDEGFSLCTLSGTRLLVLTGARHKETPLLLVRQLMY